METFNQIKTRLSKLSDKDLYNEWKSVFGDIPYNRTRNQSIWDIAHYKQEQTVTGTNTPIIETEYEPNESHHKLESLIPEMITSLKEAELLLRSAYENGMLTNSGHAIWNKIKSTLEKAK